MIRSLHILFFCLTFGGLIAQEKPLVVATASIMADMAKTLGGDLVNVRSIVPIGGDPHIYEATPEDARLAQKADLIIKNGLTFEGWLNELIENSGTRAEVVTITSGIKPVESMTYENAFDPHAWMDPLLGKVYVKNTGEALIRLLPEYEEEIRFNMDVYLGQLEDLYQYCLKRVQEIPESRRILITSHDAFQYYGRRFGLRLEAILGTSTDAEVQTSDMTRVSRVIEQSGVPAVFIESTINPKLLQQLADDHGIVIGGQLYSDSLGDREGPASTYLKMIRHNTDLIVDALKSERSEAPEKHATEYRMYWIIVGIALLVLIIFILRLINNRE